MLDLLTDFWFNYLKWFATNVDLVRAVAVPLLFCCCLKVVRGVLYV